MMNVAVIGSGISGLAAAYLLVRKHRVTLFEREPRLGGHTHTVVVDSPSGPVPLDTGFVVHNHRTYPNLVRLFGELDVRTERSDMSFSVSCPRLGLEYSSRGLLGFFGQPQRLLSADHYRLLRQIVRFNRRAPLVLDNDAFTGLTLTDYLRDEGYDALFTECYLMPLTSAIWSAAVADAGRFPVTTIVRFLHNHGMLAIASHPAWYVVAGGSHTYVPKLAAPFQSHVHSGVRRLSVARGMSNVTLTFGDDRPPLSFDQVVFACHGDQVLPLLADPSDRERAVFGRFKTTANDVWLHTDRTLLPSRPRARASWNYRVGDSSAPPHVTYHLNRLQKIAGDVDYCVTLNPGTTPAGDSVIRRMTYRHPQIDASAFAAQRRWSDVSGIQRTHYCGAYWRDGFHEDGLWSAIRVARALGVEW